MLSLIRQKDCGESYAQIDFSFSLRMREQVFALSLFTNMWYDHHSFDVVKELFFCGISPASMLMEKAQWNEQKKQKKKSINEVT